MDLWHSDQTLRVPYSHGIEIIREQRPLILLAVAMLMCRQESAAAMMQERIGNATTVRSLLHLRSNWLTR